jgi:small subunit ribosomal protein S6
METGGKQVEKRNLYEAMFLVDSALAGGEFSGVVQEISGLLGRHGAEIKQIERWSERKLAYPISGLKRGLYVLVFFEAPPENIAELRSDIALSERLVRVMILRKEEIAEPTGDLYNEEGEKIEKPAPPESEEPAEGGGPAGDVVPQVVATPPEASEEKPEEVKESGESE